MDMKWMCHPSLPGQEIEVPESAVSVHSHSGWLLMDGPPEHDETDQVARATVRGEPYDSGEPADSESMKLPTGNADDKSTDSGDENDDQPTGSKRVRRSPKGDDK